MARQAALALDRFEHRALLAADIGAGAATEIDIAGLDQPRRLEGCDLAIEDGENRRIFVAHVDEAARRIDRPGGDQHPLEEDMRRAFEHVAILEGPGLALVAVDGEEPRRRRLLHEAELLARREACTAEAAQSGDEHLAPDLVRGPGAAPESEERLVAATRAVDLEVRIGRDHRVDGARFDRRLHVLRRGMPDMVAPDDDHRRHFAPPHAGGVQHTDLRRIEPGRQRVGECIGPGEFAGERIADPDGERGRRGLVFLHHIEMRVEGRHFPDRRLRQPHLLGERPQMRGAQMAVFVLDQVQMLDQQIAPPRPIPEQRPNLCQRRIVKLPALRGAPALAAS